VKTWLSAIKARTALAVRALLALSLLAVFPAKSFALAEEELQLALLLKVAQFTSWVEQDKAEFRFCLYRGKGYEAIVAKVESPPTVGELPTRFVLLDANALAQTLQQCHLLFITEGSVVEAKQMLRRAIFSPTLTVSTLPGFAEIGGMIELVKQQNRYVFHINLSAVKQSNLSISASLLEISTIIKGGE